MRKFLVEIQFNGKNYFGFQKVSTGVSVEEKICYALEKLFETKINIGTFTFYPVIQPIVYVVFNLICCAIFGIIQLIYYTKDKLIKKENTSTIIENEEMTKDEKSAKQK